MTITDDQRWQRFKKYWEEFRGDIFKYDDGRFLFSPYNPDEPVAAGSNLEKFIDWLIRKEQHYVKTDTIVGPSDSVVAAPKT